MAGQAATGKAFEYSILEQVVNIFNEKSINIEIIENTSYTIAKGFFDDFTEVEQNKYTLASIAGLHYIFESENQIFTYNDVKICIQDDSQGILGDVRDVVLKSETAGYEIGFSAKNNHKALKHSRLSKRLDFGDKWLNHPCSIEYFDEICPIFNMLTAKKRDGIAWSDIDAKGANVYVPILEAFKRELQRLIDTYDDVPELFIRYIIGKQDFFKIIKQNRSQSTQLMVFNFDNTIINFEQTLLPTEITSIEFKENSDTTIIVTLNNDWKISFRIHSASTLVEASLKFDVTLISEPTNIYLDNVNWINE